MSAENVTGQFNALQMASQQNIQQAEMQQQQIAALAQQSMMGGALNAALQDEGFMNKVSGGAGSFMGKMMGMSDIMMDKPIKFASSIWLWLRQEKCDC